MQTRFYIEKRRDKAGKLLLKDRPVFMSVSFAGDRLMLGTGIKVNYHEWDPELQRIRNSLPGSVISNNWLDSLSDAASKTWDRLKAGQETPDRETFQKIFKDLKPRYSKGFFDVFLLFLEAGIEHWSTNTYRKVRTIFRHLREFEDHSGMVISFAHLDGLFLDRFQSFYEAKGNGQATTQKAVNILVWFMNWASEQGYNVNQEYRKFYKMLAKPEANGSRTLFLNWAELTRIRDMKFTSKKMERVRDLFCFMSFTGLRYSELQNLKKEDITEQEIVIRRKNGDPRRISLSAPAMEIYAHYRNKYYLDNMAFPSLSIITMNKYLRILALEAGLDRKVESREDMGTLIPLHECITAGMGVNTFLANAIRLDIPLEVISGFTGVNNDSRFRNIKRQMIKAQHEKLDSLSHG